MREVTRISAMPALKQTCRSVGIPSIRLDEARAAICPGTDLNGETNVTKRKRQHSNGRVVRDFDHALQEICSLQNARAAAQNRHGSFSFLQGATSRIGGAEVCPAPNLFCRPSHL